MGKIFLLNGTFAAAVTPASARDVPDASELSAIEEKLRAEGFISWDEIGREENGPCWEVGCAGRADGSRYDLKLRRRSLEMFARVA